ncbi:carcinoembryonic antigen-related cell adhesion molecule 2-like protein [Labeo rohita]|uniref:Carcinoembryonic antigen-related cell adhesion molecule 2-like protein n=1 Tax=Labeo rohita TaxID=84645 RepID=A0A498N8R0_LABRO|nr:carcinoembryonic antigen-related cell adhesion molecule 2-like protein [Labeo rohita]
MMASCSSEGDQLLYSWTLNGDSLMDGNSSIDLNEGTDGNITCSVKNHVSHGQTTINVKSCPGPTTPSVTSTAKDSEYVSVVFVLVWCFQMMGLFGLLGGFHIYMRHTSGVRHL